MGIMIGVYIVDRGYVQRLPAKTEPDHVSQDEAVPSTETESATLRDEPQVQVTKIEPSPCRGFLGQWLASTPDQPITTTTPQAPEARHRSHTLRTKEVSTLAKLYFSCTGTLYICGDARIVCM